MPSFLCFVYYALLLGLAQAQSSCSYQRPAQLDGIEPPDFDAVSRDRLQGRTCEELCGAEPDGCESFVTDEGDLCYLNAHLGFDRGVLKANNSRLYFVEKVCNGQSPVSDALPRCERKEISASFQHSNFGEHAYYKIPGYTNSARGSAHCQHLCWAYAGRGRQCLAFAVAPYWKGAEFYRRKHADICLLYFELPPALAGDLSLNTFECRDKDGNIVQPLPPLPTPTSPPATTPPPTTTTTTTTSTTTTTPPPTTTTTTVPPTTTTTAAIVPDFDGAIMKNSFFFKKEDNPECGYVQGAMVDAAAAVAMGRQLAGRMLPGQELRHCSDNCYSLKQTRDGCVGWFVTTGRQCWIFNNNADVSSIPAGSGLYIWGWTCADPDATLTTTNSPTPPPSQGFPIVSLGPGEVEGAIVSLDGLNFGVFHGIPYAKPPVGGLRMRETEPVEPWSGRRDATDEDYPICHQFFAPQLSLPQSEDCLFLDVFTPKTSDADSALRPVIVYVHGGTFVLGSSRDFHRDGYLRSLVSQDVVVVVIQYRLGPFGFYHNKAAGYNGNYGLYDVREALAFIQREIEKFGGDPDSVTLLGESAGATAVQILNSSPAMKAMQPPLFHKAIMMSGPYFAQPADVPDKYPQQLTAALCSDPTSCDMAAISLAEISQASLSIFLRMGRGGGAYMWGPTVDGSLVTELGDGTDSSVAEAVLIGTTKDEMRYFVNATAPPPLDVYPMALEQDFDFILGGFHNSEVIRQALRAKWIEFGLSKFAKISDPEEKAMAWLRLHEEAMGTAVFYAPAFLHAEQLTELGVPVFFYSFDYVSPTGFQGLWYAGAPHVYDLAVLLQTNPPERTSLRLHLLRVTEEDREMGKRWGLFLANFAREANPTPSAVDGFRWDAFQPDQYNFASINDPTLMKKGYHCNDVPFYIHFVLRMAWAEGRCVAAHPYIDRSLDFEERKTELCNSFCPAP